MSASAPRADAVLAAVLPRLVASSSFDAAAALAAVASCAHVSRAWRAASCDERIWRTLVLRMWPSAAAAHAAEPPVDGWRAHAQRCTLAARRSAAQRWTLDVADFTLCMDMHDACTGALVTSAQLTLDEDMLPAREYGHWRSVTMSSAVAQLAPGAAWPPTARVRLLALRGRDGAVASVLAGTASRSDNPEFSDYSEVEEDEEDEDEDDDLAFLDGEEEHAADTPTAADHESEESDGAAPSSA